MIEETLLFFTKRLVAREERKEGKHVVGIELREKKGRLQDKRENGR